jgi:4a-hydroxytetrahydrobiopterin dehydratase
LWLFSVIQEPHSLAKLTVVLRRGFTTRADVSEDSFHLQDFGARDPTPGEIGSNFGEKIVMNWDTEHIIK